MHLLNLEGGDTQKEARRMVSDLQKSQMFSNMAMPSNSDFFCHFSFLVQSHQRKVEGIQMKGEGRSLCHSSPVQCQKPGALWRQAQGKPETGSSWIASTTCAINHRLSHPFLYSPGGNEAFPTLSQESLVVPAALTPCCGWGQQHKRNCSSDGNLFH